MTGLADAIAQVLEANPARFAGVARHVNRLPGTHRARDYVDAEIDQLSSGMVRILLEAVRNEEPKFRALFMDHAMPSFIREGETTLTLVRWNASYLVLFSAALADAVPAQHRTGLLEWFAEFSGVYIADVLRAGIEATSLQNGSAT
jgi:hypothetical protein